MLQSMGSQGVGHDFLTEQQQQYTFVRHLFPTFVPLKLQGMKNLVVKVAGDPISKEIFPGVKYLH